MHPIAKRSRMPPGVKRSLTHREGNMLDLSGKSKEEEKRSPGQPLVTQKAISVEEVEKSVSVFAIIALIVVVIAAGCFYVGKVYKKSQLKNKEAVYTDLLTQLAAKDISEVDKTAQELQKGLKILQTALAGQLNYSKLFQELQKITPKNVKLNNFIVGDKDEMKIDGEANDYSSVAKAMASFSGSEMFSDVKLVSSTTSETTEGKKVSFSFTLQLNKTQLK